MVDDNFTFSTFRLFNSIVGTFNNKIIKKSRRMGQIHEQNQGGCYNYE